MGKIRDVVDSNNESESRASKKVTARLGNHEGGMGKGAGRAFPQH